MNLEHLSPYTTEKEHLQLLEDLLARHNERIHKLEGIIAELYCCSSCSRITPKGAQVFFGKEYWSMRESFAPYERDVMKMSCDSDGTWWFTTTYVDRNGYTCSKWPAQASLVETMGSARHKWFKNKAT